MADSIVVKVKYNDIIRRVRLPKNDRLSFNTLEIRIRDILHFPQPATIGMTYVDADGDLITMADDKDFVEAVVHQGLNPLTLYVKGLDEAVPTRSPSTSSDQSKADSQELPKAATDSPKIDTNTASKPAGTKMHKDLADMISEQLAKALGGLHGEMSGLESHINNALNDSKFKEFLDSAPSKLAEVLQAATRSGFDASFEPMFYPPQGPCQKSAQPQTASSPASSPEGVSGTGTNEQKTPGQAGQVKKVAHHGVQCDVCDMLPITGIRFKSLTKDDYDLCEKCFAEHGKEAEYKRIEQPLFAHRTGHPFCQIGRNVVSDATSAPGFSAFPGLGGRPFPCSMAAKAAAAFEKLSGLDARFVKDVSIFDGTEVAPASQVTKIWRLQNSGVIPWPQHTRLVHVGGHKLGSQDSVSLEIGEEGLSAGKEIEVSVDMVIPLQPGRYVSHWRLAVPGSLQFGQRVWAMVQVIDPSQPASQVPQSPPVGTKPTVEKGEASSTPIQTAPAPAPPTSSPVKGAEVDPTTATDFGSPKTATEATAVGDFSVVEHSTPTPTPTPTPNPTPSPSLTSASGVSGEEKVVYPIVVPITGPIPSAPGAEEVEEEKVEVEESGPEDEFEEAEDDKSMMVQQLVQMGFSDKAVNVEVLKKNNFDLQSTLDELVTAVKWDGALNELEEMGFSDRSKNLSLLYKFDGNAKAVVRMLVQELGQK